MILSMYYKNQSSYGHKGLMHCCLKQQIFLPLVTIQRMKNCRAKLNSTGSFILKGLAAWPQHQQLSPEAAGCAAASVASRRHKYWASWFSPSFSDAKAQWVKPLCLRSKEKASTFPYIRITYTSKSYSRKNLARLRDSQGSFSFLDFKGFKKALTHSQPIEFRHVFLGLLSFMNVKVILTSIKTLNSW